jgi:hypothetical protein
MVMAGEGDERVSLWHILTLELRVISVRWRRLVACSIVAMLPRESALLHHGLKSLNGRILLLLAVLTGCSATDASSPDASTDAAVGQDGPQGDGPQDGATQESSREAETPDSAMTDGGPEGDDEDSSHEDSGLQCTVDGAFSGAVTSCQYAPCPAGCACIEEGTRRNVACMCLTAKPDGQTICLPPASPTCGTILCEPPLQCLRGGCAEPEGPDASALDGGPLCSNDGGLFPGPSGTCSSLSCAPGCACVATTTGGMCLCPKAQDAGTVPVCITPSCGAIFCESGCTCTDAAAGTCECSAGADGGDPTGKPCTSHADCGGGLFDCLYPLSGKCGATPTCLPINPSAGACIAVALCGCDGTNFSDTFCDKSGTSKPVAYVGQCEAGSD